MPDEKKILHTIGANIRKERKRQNLTQLQVEEGAGLAENNLGKIERGEVEIGIIKLIKIATFLKVPLNNIYLIK